MRKYSFITVGKILEVLKEQENLKISRPTFMRLMLQKNLFSMSISAGGWYVCSEEQANTIVKLIKKNYNVT